MLKTTKLREVSREITHRNVQYVLCPCTDINRTASFKQTQGYRVLVGEMPLHKSLRGRTDLHGNPYKPSKFLYVSTEKKLL